MINGIPDYDPDTCITAGELRADGVNIPDTIPDCAWISRSSLIPVSFNAVHVGNNGAVCIETSCSITEPFRWIEATITLPGKDEASK